MQPTMKLRYVQRGWKNVTRPSFTDREPVYVLQQWYEGAKIKPEYAHLAPGSIIPWDEVTELTIYEPCGEWRDIPIEVES